MAIKELVLVVGYSFPREQEGGSGTFPGTGLGWAGLQLSVGRWVPPEVAGFGLLSISAHLGVEPCPLTQEEGWRGWSRSDGGL